MTISELLKEERQNLKLEVVAGQRNLDRKITVPEVNRPGLALGGYLEHFRSERIQIIGRGEHAYCVQAPPDRLKSVLGQMLCSPEIPCLVVTRGLKGSGLLVEACRRAGVPLLRTSLDTATFVGELTAYLEDRLAPFARVHGVLVDVYGLGVLIQGDSGIGKSECALELLKRGHILVSDDIVEIRKKRGGILVGSCPENLRHFMEVRGLGIIDVKLLFGIGSILNLSRIEMAVYLEMWKGKISYDRTGLEEKSTHVLGVELPLIRIPVSPGRNLAVLIEVAALNQRLRSQGYHTAKAFNASLIRRMKRKVEVS
ncbi:MAG: HPr(Ser) kinase/phosphatase [Elusimicrobia bacterium]|nr:HPr(Ser) kinase/phosphatase [Elusimicrobiota bacterium]